MARGARLVLLTLLAAVWLLPGCPQVGPPNNELRQEVQGLKGEVAALKEKVAKLESGQQAILEQLKKAGAPSPAAALPEPPAPMQSPGQPQVLSVADLLANQDRYVGTRVTVQGPVGPVLVHHKSLLLKAPQGMVEVFFGKLPDEKQVQRLTSMTLDRPVTVTGVVSAAPKGGAKVQIQAEAIEF